MILTPISHTRKIPKLLAILIYCKSPLGRGFMIPGLTIRSIHMNLAQFCLTIWQCSDIESTKFDMFTSRLICVTCRVQTACLRLWYHYSSLRSPLARHSCKLPHRPVSHKRLHLETSRCNEFTICKPSRPQRVACNQGHHEWFWMASESDEWDLLGLEAKEIKQTKLISLSTQYTVLGHAWTVLRTSKPWATRCNQYQPTTLTKGFFHRSGPSRHYPLTWYASYIPWGWWTYPPASPLVLEPSQPTGLHPIHSWWFFFENLRPFIRRR